MHPQPKRKRKPAADAVVSTSALEVDREAQGAVCARLLAHSLTHLTGIKPPACLDSFLAKHQIEPAQPAGLLDGHHRTEKRIDFAIDHALCRGVAHGGQRDVEHVERHGGDDAEETVEEDRM